MPSPNPLVVEFHKAMHEIHRKAKIEAGYNATRPHRRESYVGMIHDDGTVLKGFVDLIYREDDGSPVIVDYKTDDAPDAALGQA